MSPSTSTPSSGYPSLSPSIDTITTIAGTGATGYSGDNGAATSATLHNPQEIVVDSSGTIT